METNGSISILPKAAFAPVVNSSLKIEADENTLPITLVSEGSIIKENLTLANITKFDVEKIIKKAKIPNLKDVLVLTINKHGYVYIQENNQPFKTFIVDYKGENLT